MQRMIILGLGKKQLFLAHLLYNTLPDTYVKEDNGKLIVETKLSKEDMEHITKQYNKTGNVVLFEDI